jgi:hypothetical protein
MKNKVVYFIVSAFLMLLINGCTSIPTVTGSDCKNNIYPEYDKVINYFKKYTMRCTKDIVVYGSSSNKTVGCWRGEKDQSNPYTSPFTRDMITRKICGSRSAKGYEKCVNYYSTATKVNETQEEIKVCGGKIIKNFYKNTNALSSCGMTWSGLQGLKEVSRCINKYQPQINKDREILLHDKTH